MIWSVLFPGFFFLQSWSCTAQDCPSNKQLLVTLSQIQKLLSGHEDSYFQKLSTMRKKLNLLQATMHRHISRVNETCPDPEIPANSRKLGNIFTVGHEVHFVCDPGFELIGSETRICEKSTYWGGQQPYCQKIDGCSSKPCLNGGTCVEEDNHFLCICSRAWSGKYCQNPTNSHWASWTNSSFSRQPHCTSAQGSIQCTCDVGFQMSGRDSNLCHDVDECELYQSGRLSRICMYACVNTPGSYRCTCPPGYNLGPGYRFCKDVDECAGRQHNCSQDELCVNTFGGFQCVRPECPKTRHNTSYVKTSPVRCERNPCPVGNKVCAQSTSSISFHYQSLVSNYTTPHVLFRMSAIRQHGDSLRFAVVGGRGRRHFGVQRANRLTGELVLVSPVLGPTVLEADFEMTEYDKRVLLGRYISKVIVFVSQYDF
ncbi:fibulin-7 [Erpetoichthys calabaricus]|uniref:fibulin-7 n=1 Tax=Erpetoichthys calabaricus TaxID=27687 RepID=UPI002233E4DB|nr:fibulin-7 [Erpetoichthys calabaricus]